MKRITTVAELRATVAAARGDGDRIGLVPTMGALHRGHLSLVTTARSRCDLLVVSIFVNPTQFGPGEDLASYPRDVDGDESLLAALGDAAPDIVFAPSVDEVYRGRQVTTVRVAGLTEGLCGATRPGHFDGVATVVTKLFNLVAPDVAVFGRKDYQQLAIIRAMTLDLDLPVEVVGAATVREDDGVAMSSRNAYLDPDQRQAATALSRALRAGVLTARAAREAGRAPDPGMIRNAVAVRLDADPQVRIDYVSVVDPETLEPPEPPDSTATPSGGAVGGDGAGRARRGAEAAGRRLLVAVAAHIGPARLIDNVVIGDNDDEQRLLTATDRVAELR